jgi:hypothetical protein
MKGFWFWISAAIATVAISGTVWFGTIAPATAQTVNGDFTQAAEACVMDTDAQAALAACDRALAINNEDAIPWYGKAQALEKLGRQAEAQTAYVQFDFMGRYYGAMLRPIQSLQQRLIIVDLIENPAQVAELQQRIAELQTQLNGNSLGAEEQEQAQLQLDRLRSIEEVYTDASQNPQALADWHSRTLSNLLELRKSFVEARASL